ncbi:hypothetical protein BGZ67_009772 [Mortierella alpina]|nr:hypothetical protein BGZ67_009772 [Mortierella alpina]
MHVHPLDLPEIVRRFQQYMRPCDLPICIRVCRQWHNAFIPYVWRSVPPSQLTTDDGDYYSPRFCLSKLSAAALQKHAHLVHSLFWCTETDAALTELDTHHDIVFSNLESFSFNGHNLEWDLFPAFLKRHPAISSLNMHVFRGSVQYRLLQTILNHPTPLKSLNISNCLIDRDSMQLFWRVCTLPERLEMTCVNFTPTTHNDERLLGLAELVDRQFFASLDFSRVKTFSMFESELPSVDHIEVIAKCTQLERLCWGPWSQWNNPRPDDFSTRVANLGSRGYLRHLKALIFLPSFPAISDPELAIILDSINLDCGNDNHQHDGGAYLEQMTLWPRLMIRIVVEAASVEQQIQHNRAVLKQPEALEVLDNLYLLRPLPTDPPECLQDKNSSDGYAFAPSNGSRGQDHSFDSSLRELGQAIAQQDDMNTITRLMLPLESSLPSSAPSAPP